MIPVTPIISPFYLTIPMSRLSIQSLINQPLHLRYKLHPALLIPRQQIPLNNNRDPLSAIDPNSIFAAPYQYTLPLLLPLLPSFRRLSAPCTAQPSPKLPSGSTCGAETSPGLINPGTAVVTWRESLRRWAGSWAVMVSATLEGWRMRVEDMGSVPLFARTLRMRAISAEVLTKPVPSGTCCSPSG